MRKIEEKVFGKVYSQYFNAVFLYLFSLCHNRVLAEDLTQDTFFKAMLSLSEGKEILPWLFTVAKNLFIDNCRKAKRSQSTELSETPGDDNVLEKIISGEKNRRLYTEIQNLKDAEKEAVALFYFAGLSQMQIAAHMGVSHTNLRSILHRARKKLYTKLKED